MWIAELRGTGFEERARRAHHCAQVVAEQADTILYGTKGKTAGAFNRLAEGVACAAYQPGGVTVLGLHFEAA